MVGVIFPTGTAMRFDVLKQKSIHSVVAIAGLLSSAQ
jgi:hypothetical protein